MLKIHQIIKSFLEGEYPEKTNKGFFKWFFSSHSKVEKEEALYDTWNEMHILPDSTTKDSYNNVISRLQIDNKKYRFNISTKFMRIAATILIPILSFTTVYWFMQSSEAQTTEFVEYFTNNSKIETIKLPDGSTVTMNCGSIIIYPRNFTKKNREIFLSGEAKFTVMHDNNRPFIVKTNDMNVRALGTVFNVSSYAEDSKTVATLISGKVKVNMKSSSEEYLLDPSQQVVYDKESKTSDKRLARTDLELAWEGGNLVFQDASIDDIMQEIQRKYDVRIYANFKATKGEKLTVKFENGESIEEIFRTLHLLINEFNYKIEGNKIYIY